MCVGAGSSGNPLAVTWGHLNTWEAVALIRTSAHVGTSGRVKTRGITYICGNTYLRALRGDS